MSKEILRIATRESPLAMWQAEYVKKALEEKHNGLKIELLPMTTKGDKILDAPLSKIGGKGLFMKELETALLDGSADIAVHSMKDVPMELPEGLELTAIFEREDCRDAFVSNHFASLDELPESAVVGSSSLRRQCQLKALRPDLEIRNLRGNVNTRLRKLDEGEYQAIILAAAGLKRLGLEERITKHLDTYECLPAAGQGAVGVECRAGDWDTIALFNDGLRHMETTFCVLAERAMNARLNGGCQVPIACLAEITEMNDKTEIYIRGLVGTPDGKRILRSDRQGWFHLYDQLGNEVAEDLLARGAGEILKNVELIRDQS